MFNRSLSSQSPVANKDPNKSTRILYVIEALFEYFVTLMFETVYIAEITKSLGMSDGLTGIMTSIISLGSTFQIISVFLASKRPVKRWVTFGHIVSQCFFAFVYFIPIVNFSREIKVVLFMILLIGAYVIHNVINTPKISWYMSFVSEHKRGRFTALKESWSLAGGMVYSFVLGTIFDNYKNSGNIREAFIFCGITIFGLMALHSLTLFFSKAKPVTSGEVTVCSDANENKISIGQELKSFIKNKTLIKIILLMVVWNIVSRTGQSFLGSYMNNELAFDKQFVSIVTICVSILRIPATIVLGRIADKISFAGMLNICWVFLFGEIISGMLITPANGKVMYVIHAVCKGICTSGTGSATINLLYDYIDNRNASGALAIQQSFIGLTSFLSVTAVSFLVTEIQQAGNTFLGISAYAQQVVFALLIPLLIFLVFYLNFVIRKMRRVNLEENKQEEKSSVEEKK